MQRQSDNITKDICVFGDNISYGAWDTEGGWVDRLRRFLHNRTIESDFHSYYFVYNLCIPGETTEDLLKRFSSECASREPHFIIFAIGINDASQQKGAKKSRVPLKQFESNLRMLLAQTRQYTNEVLFIGLTRVDESRTQPFDEMIFFANETIDEYRTVAREICENAETVFFDVADILDPDDLEDGLYPNAAGHEKLFKAVKECLLKGGVI